MQKIIILTVQLFLIVMATGSVQAGTKDTKIYSFGVVPQFDSRTLQKIWSPILKELEKRTSLKFRMSGSPKIPDFENSFMAEEFDFAYMNPYHAMLAGTERDYIPLVRDHGRKLFGILVVQKNSPIKSISELDGKEISFPAPNALGASLLMRADMANIHNISIRPKYVQTHSSVYLNVVLGATVAGGGVAGTLSKQNPKIRDSLKTIYTTRAISPHPVTAHSRVPKAARDAVRDAFLQIGQSKAGSKMLSKVPFKKIGPATAADYANLKNWGLKAFYVKD